MYKKGMVIAIICLFVGTGVVPSVISNETVIGYKDYIYVDDDAHWSWYDAKHVKTIQEGVDNASARDTVFVYSGTYDEDISINKEITLLGEGRSDTVIHLLDDVVDILVSGITICGFTILDCGIQIQSNQNIIYGNFISYDYDNDYGIYLSNSNTNTIKYNIIFGNIKLHSSSNNQIFCNTINSENNKGIILSTNSCSNKIFSNNISSHDCGIFFCISSNNNQIYENLISNSNYGIRIYGSSDNRVGSNTISNNDHGVQIEILTSDNIIYHNYFIESIYHGYDGTPEASNKWDDGFEGNYWDDYETQYPYANHNGEIWDTPYYLPIRNYDNYPLVKMIQKNNPPYPPIVTGPPSGEPEQTYEYRFEIIDPDNDDISYCIEWGDGTKIPWIETCYSNIIIKISHNWSKRGLYTIRAKARDEHGAESDWGTLKVEMPKNKAINPFLLFLERLIERFPILEQILQPVYDKLTGF